jgi:hypothetical protein
MHLTKKQAFIAKSMGVNLPFTPKFTREEKRIMARLMVDGRDINNTEKLAHNWLVQVVGKQVFPKRLVHLRAEIKNIIKVSRIRDETDKSKVVTQRLDL